MEASRKVSFAKYSRLSSETGEVGEADAGLTPPHVRAEAIEYGMALRSTLSKDQRGN